MTDAELCELIDDPEISLLADLFLDFLRLDRSSRGYRYLRDAVIASPAFADGLHALYVAIGELENSDPELIDADVENLLRGVDIAGLFNSAYGTPNRLCVTMPDFESDCVDSSVSFLAAVFAYIRYLNYHP